MIPPQRPSHWLSVVLVCLLLAANGPATVLAQSEPSEGQDRVYLPFVQQPAQLSSSEQTLESDDGPAVTEVEIPPAAVGQVMAANRIAYLPAYVTDNRLERPIYTAAAGLPRLSPALRAASGRRQVVVRLLEPSVGEMVAFQVGAASVDRQQAQLATLQTAQAALISEVQSLDASAVVLGTVQKALNAVILEVDTAALPELAANPAVLSVRPVVDYEQALTETVPYIGATAVQQAGFDGRGVRVAVVDSGIDYTHKHFGGPGTVAAYELAYGKVITDPRNTARDGLFPTPKVLEGVDFVGESWPDGDLAPDDDPIDFEGHGTHVADIIGGNGGVAPGVELFADKVCSSIDTACRGVALIQAMDYVLDPNGDGDLSDHMDVVNMSLGANYGTAFDDDLSYAVDVASALGVLTIASAGNGADKP
ncbi:MAG TPA: S8 family serine peptidase, partial [Caldilineaceae bacterium]|nr:S8 family serine peptidase [Caldilineaceae bacterium]